MKQDRQCGGGKQVRKDWIYGIRPYWVRFRRRWGKWFRWLIIGLVLFFSPFIAWVILAINREFIHFLVNASWARYVVPGAFEAMREDVNSRWFVTGFSEAALGGLLTLYGVAVTVWYYHAVRMQEVADKRIFVLDELIGEMRKNRQLFECMEDAYSSCKANGERSVFEEVQPQGSLFFIEAWHKLGADVSLLPRRFHLKLSGLYGVLSQCRDVGCYEKQRGVIQHIPEILGELLRYRDKLSRSGID